MKKRNDSLLSLRRRPPAAGRSRLARFLFGSGAAYLLLSGAAGLYSGSSAGTAEAAAASPDELHTDLADLSLRQLLEVPIITASRKPEKIMETAAAVFVITQEDIRRSGATALPDGRF